MFAIVDCNNFYASCERVFNPQLDNKPIVVLSNNDGCAIARSDEAKALGIEMGQPYFTIKPLCRQHRVVVMSSNYTLYGDMSQRVMTVIEENWPETEVYSIDEAFLDLTSLPAAQVTPFCVELQRKIRRYTGIPVSIGLGKTKTLAKLANFVAKRKLRRPVYDIHTGMDWLARIPIEKVWGIGRRLTAQLNALGYFTAAELAAADPERIHKRFSVVVRQTVMELQGHRCFRLNEETAKKSIGSAKSFGQLQTEFEPIAAALATYCARASEKLREQQSCANGLAVFVRTNPFRRDLPQYSKSIAIELIHATNDVRVITTHAKRALQIIYKKGLHYKKVGVHLLNIAPQSVFQNDIFWDGTSQYSQGQQTMAVLDAINRKFGRGTLRTASEGYEKPWAARKGFCSPCYTTRWSDLPIVWAH